MNEQENINLPKWYHLSPEAFEHKIDSLKAIKENIYQDFLQGNAVPELFKKTVNASIDYDYFMKKELYVLANTSRKTEYSPNFLSHRKEADLNQENLRYYYPYYRFLIYY